MQNRIDIGVRFTWQAVGGGPFCEAVVTGLRSDRQEGLSPESEDYAAFWVEARTTASEGSQQPFTIMVGTDGKSYKDGEEISITTLS